jgi:HD-GYP domain-containing protein (c-di-GMP phosphodiesterase class II)
MSKTDFPTWSLDVARAIMEAVKVKDEATYSHCVRVSRGSRLLAQAAGLSENEQRVVEFAGLFHDIGKIGVPDAILNKPDRLNPAEYEIMKHHPEMSAQILAPLLGLEFFKSLIPGVLHHHERFDAGGYPKALGGEKIPLEARIILVADTFDAMTETRSYRKGLPVDRVYQELKTHAGRQFDPRLVAIFLAAHPTWRPQDDNLFEEVNQTILKAA